MAAETPFRVHADAADVAAASFARRGEVDEWAISRCMVGHYREALAGEEGAPCIRTATR